MKKKEYLIITICLVIIALLVYQKNFNPSLKKIGVVEMDKLVFDYKGMKEATKTYGIKVQSWTQKSDSLENHLKTLYEQIRLDSINKDINKLNVDIKSFMYCNQNYNEYVEKTRMDAEQEDKQMTLGILNQINEYIKLYAKENGYDAILCNSMSQQQSVGYVDTGMDITQNLIEFANAKYEGVK